MIEFTDSELDDMIQLVKSGRVEFTRRAPLLVKLENERDTRQYGAPLVQRDNYVGGPIVHLVSKDW